LRDSLFLLAMLGIAILALGRIDLCIALWAWVTLLDPNYWVYSFASMIHYNKVAAGLTIISILISKEKKKFHLHSASIILIFFLFIVAVSQFSALSENPTGWEILDKFSKMVLLNLLIVNFMRSRLRIHTLALSICLGVGCFAVISALKFIVSGGAHIVLGTPNLGDNNGVALIVLMTIPILAFLRTEFESWWMRHSVLGVMVLFVVCVVATNSRGGFVGLVVLSLSGFASSRHKLRYIIAIAFAGAILSQVVPDRLTHRIQSIESADQDSSFMGRVIAWKLSTLIALDHPFFGGGPHALQVQSVWTVYTNNFSRLSFIPTNEPDVTPHAAHSIYFEVLGDTGFLGLLTFVCLIVSGFRTGSRIIVMARDHPQLHWAKGLAEKLRLSLLVFVVSGAALSATYQDLTFIVLGMLSTIHGIVSAELSGKPSRADPSEKYERAASSATLSPKPLPASRRTALPQG
jgi:putative inorganic carbon (hco3(-)) transporter